MTLEACVCLYSSEKSAASRDFASADEGVSLLSPVSLLLPLSAMSLLDEPPESDEPLFIMPCTPCTPCMPPTLHWLSLGVRSRVLPGAPAEAEAEA
eukprot:scaffold66827_cov63-Phaeocystis_antarctica.AAC.2